MKRERLNIRPLIFSLSMKFVERKLVLYSVFKKEGVKVKGYYTVKKWILGAV